MMATHNLGDIVVFGDEVCIVIAVTLQRGGTKYTVRTIKGKTHGDLRGGTLTPCAGMKLITSKSAWLGQTVVSKEREMFGAVEAVTWDNVWIRWTDGTASSLAFEGIDLLELDTLLFGESSGAATAEARTFRVRQLVEMDGGYIGLISKLYCDTAAGNMARVVLPDVAEAKRIKLSRLKRVIPLAVTPNSALASRKVYSKDGPVRWGAIYTGDTTGCSVKWADGDCRIVENCNLYAVPEGSSATVAAEPAASKCDTGRVELTATSATGAFSVDNILHPVGTDKGFTAYTGDSIIDFGKQRVGRVADVHMGRNILFVSYGQQVVAYNLGYADTQLLRVVRVKE